MVTIEKEKEFYNRIGEILFNEWDPIGISNANWPKDEYQSYTPQVFKIALRASSPEEIAEYLNSLTTERMGLESKMEHDLNIAKRILSERKGIE